MRALTTEKTTMTDLTMSQFASKDDLLAAQAARIAELESQLEAIGAGGVEPLRKQAAAPQAVQAAVPDGWMLVPMNGTEEMARAFRAESTPELFYMTTIQCADFQERYRAMLNAAPVSPAHPPEGVPAQCPNINEPRGCWRVACQLGGKCREPERSATQPAAQGMDAIRALIAQHGKELERNHYAYFELAYTRRTGWMVWITDKPAFRESVLVNPDRKVLWQGQGDTPDEACENAAIAAQAKQGG